MFVFMLSVWSCGGGGGGGGVRVACVMCVCGVSVCGVCRTLVVVCVPRVMIHGDGDSWEHFEGSLHRTFP